MYSRLNGGQKQVGRRMDGSLTTHRQWFYTSSVYFCFFGHEGILTGRGILDGPGIHLTAGGWVRCDR